MATGSLDCGGFQRLLRKLRNPARSSVSCVGVDPVPQKVGVPGMSRPIRRVQSLGDHPSRTTVASRLQRPTRMLGRAALGRMLSGLAPGGVYLAAPVTWGAGGLLHHRFTLTCASAGGLLSVALSRGSPRVAVSHHPALRSPDVPRRERTPDAAAWPAHPWSSLSVPVHLRRARTPPCRPRCLRRPPSPERRNRARRCRAPAGSPRARSVAPATPPCRCCRPRRPRRTLRRGRT